LREKEKVLKEKKAAKMASRIIRITMFKIPSKSDQAKALENYSTLSKTATKVPPPSTQVFTCIFKDF
jgi:hypothetical protein